MKCIYSFNSEPFFSAGERSFGGFFSKELFLSCAKKSVENSKKYFSEVELYLDEKSFELFKDFDVKKTKIIVDSKGVNFFADSKKEAYKLQKKEFVHLDFDFILHENIPQFTDIIAETEESSNFYEGYLYDCQKTVDIDAITEFYNRGLQNYYAINCGIIGFKDLDFLSRYIENWEKLSKYYNRSVEDMCFVEQCLLACMAHKENRNVLFIKDKINYKHYIGIKKQEYEI